MRIKPEGKLIYDETRRIIKKAKADNRLVIFVGAGASIDSGMPSWSQAVKQIAARLPLTYKDASCDLLKIPQFYYNSRGKKEYTQLMREVFLYEQPLKTTLLHKKIIECQAETIITTNYDNLIEQASEENAEVRYVISKDHDLPYKNTSRELIKMHGDFENDNFVLKEDDYLQYSNNFRLIETYIKSLIGSKVVLIVGYSLNDPDVKQILTWTKDVLKDDFQRAYLILSGKEKNEIERDYFRNLGVNIIYTSELVDDWEKKLHTEQLVEVFDYILEDEEEQVLDQVYNELKPLQNLNYVYGKYIRNALLKLGISCDGKEINLWSHMQSQDNDNEGFKFLLWTYINDENAPELQSLDESECEKLKVIKNVMEKSCFECINRITDNGYQTVQLCNNSTDQIEKCVSNFDYMQLDSIKNKNAMKLASDVPDLYMQQAYISVLLNDHYTAYNCLKNAAKIYYHNKNFMWYFLAEFNRKHVGKVCLSMPWLFTLSEDERSQMDVEVKAINIEQILATIPDLGHNHNEFLLELSNFRVLYSLFYSMFDDAVKVNEQAKTAYSFFYGTAAYEKLRRNAQDYNNYETRNYIMLDGYNKVRSIFLLYLRSVLSSVTAEDIPESILDGEEVEAGNIKEDKLKTFDLYIMLRYLNQSDLKQLFTEYDIKILPIDEDALQYIEKISDSMFNARKYVKYNVYSRDIFWTYLELISHIEISGDLAIKILEHLSSSRNGQDFEIYTECINRFIVNLSRKKYYQNLDIPKFESTIIDNILEFIISDPRHKWKFKGIIWNLSYICKQSGNSYDDAEKINNLIGVCGKDFFVNLYENLGINCQKQLLDHFNGWKPENNADDYCLYCDAVLSGVIKPDIDIERRIYDWIAKSCSEKNDNKNSAVKMAPRPRNYSDVIKELINLFLNNRIQDVECLTNCVKQFGDLASNWLLNLNEFNYEDFDCNWLSMCRPGLLCSIAKNEVANKSILKAYKKQYKSKAVLNKIGDIIVRYFISGPDEGFDEDE